MAIKKIANRSNSGIRRPTVIDYRQVLTATRPVRALTESKSKHAGRNNQGKITVRHHGGGGRRQYRLIDFKRNVGEDKVGTIKTVEYDPNRSAFISLVTYETGARAYILAPHGLKVGAKIVASHKAVDIQVGNCMPLEFIPEGTMVHNIEFTPRAGGQVARSAGAYAQILGSDESGRYVILKLSSGESRKFLKQCRATVGVVSNTDHNLVVIGKAGRNRHRGIRPTVRGSVMNPNDHPHGGGEGRTPVGRDAPRTPWGKRHMGVKTRNKKKASSALIIHSK